MQQFKNFTEFYPYYLAEHGNRICRRMHFVGSTLGLASLVLALVTASPVYLLIGLAGGYASAWTGHFFFEHNRPATFRHPVYSFLGDWLMYRDMLRGRISF